MLPKILTLDASATRDILRPFHFVASAFAVVLMVMGLLVGAIFMMQSFLLGLLFILLTETLGVSVFLGVRLAVEAVNTVALIRERFIEDVAGDPNMRP